MTYIGRHPRTIGITPHWFLHHADPRPWGTVALYRLYDRNRELIYIGVCGNSIWDRLIRHQREQLWGGQIQHYSLEFYSKLHLALDAERAAIQAERPLHNIRSAAA